jgi:uncharacterized protein YjbJ (UPF0337 family)
MARADTVRVDADTGHPFRLPCSGRAYCAAHQRRRPAAARPDVKEPIMSVGDKAKDAVQKAAGHAEEFVGKHTDDEELTRQGQFDQDKGEARMNVEQAKDDADDVDASRLTSDDTDGGGQQ